MVWKYILYKLYNVYYWLQIILKMFILIVFKRR